MYVIVVIGCYFTFNFSTNDELILERSMKTNNNDSDQGTKTCKLCKEQFIPHPRVKDRQKVCRDYDCQQLRQKLNRLDWLERNPVDYQEWYQQYGKVWQQSHRNYQRDYRKRVAEQVENNNRKATTTKHILKPLLWLYQHEKKEELTSVKTNSHKRGFNEKKEELTHCLYLVKARQLEFLPLKTEKREELSNCI
jgi:hypothetical protein